MGLVCTSLKQQVGGSRRLHGSCGTLHERSQLSRAREGHTHTVCTTRLGFVCTALGSCSFQWFPFFSTNFRKETVHALDRDCTTACVHESEARMVGSDCVLGLLHESYAHFLLKMVDPWVDPLSAHDKRRVLALHARFPRGFLRWRHTGGAHAPRLMTPHQHRLLGCPCSYYGSRIVKSFALLGRISTKKSVNNPG